LSDSNSLTARLQREMLLIKAKAEALEFAVSEKDAELELLRQRQERQDTQVRSLDAFAAHTYHYSKQYSMWFTPTHICVC